MLGFSSPVVISFIPLIGLISFDISFAIDFNSSKSSPLIITCIPEPAKAPISILDELTFNSQSKSFVLSSIILAISVFECFLSSFNFIKNDIVVSDALPSIELVESVAPIVSISSIFIKLFIILSLILIVSFLLLPIGISNVADISVESILGIKLVPIDPTLYTLNINKATTGKITAALCFNAHLSDFS